MRYLIIIMMAGLIACDEQSKQVIKKEIYQGPHIEMRDVETLFSDSTIIRLKIKAPLQQIFDNGDENYPEGMYLEIYDEKQQLVATFRSNTARKVATEEYYIGEGNVIVKNLETGDELTTEQLYWYQDEEVFRTDKFVTIKSEGELHTGEGLEASQDFSYYKILKPTGTISIDDPEQY